MTIGIITFWQSKENYGQILQSFALQEYLRKQGHQPTLIRYRDTKKSEPSFRFTRVFGYLKKFPVYVKWFISEKRRKRHEDRYKRAMADVDRKFSEFMEKYITHTDEVYTETSIIANPPAFDAYICGSDQIWGGDAPYYLNFVPEGNPRIAYAPSLGGLKSFAAEYEIMMTDLLSRFDFIGMREQSGVDTCHRLGRKDAVKVVDPTLLLKREDYDKLRPSEFTDSSQSSPYILAYVLGNPMECDIVEIVEYARLLDLPLKYVTSSGQTDKYPHIYPTPGEWIDLIANASMVITNSFHGTVFSLIYHRPFITIPLNRGYERMNTRIDELLSECNLSRRVYRGSLNEIGAESVDFSSFDRYQATQEHFSASKLFPILSR